MLNLINCTSHQQDLLQWMEEARETIYFPFDGRPLAGPIAPDRPLHPQVMALWRKVLEEIDAAYAEGVCVSGVMVAGYAPSCIGVAAQCRNFRLPIYVSVAQKVEPPPSWAKSPFIPCGVRWIRPAPFAAVASRTKAGASNPMDGLVHMAPRPLNGERQSLIESLVCRIAKSAVVHPPPPQGDAAGESRALEAAVASALKGAVGVLLDGPPIETALTVWAHCMAQGIPVFYLRTEPAPPPLFAMPVGIERMPY